ncbi:MAG: hypothetical protein JSV04_07675 [Candidatus Heimdallarchaeota archaeon]|nr:MAG: hypothetical protein JSV04_07675 [Candidatus Heimdallarchaeota archaeon]
MVGTEPAASLAKDVFKKCSPELVFRFFGSNGKVLAEISNLSELISTLPDIPATIAQFHIFRETDQDLFDSRQLDGPVVRSDLALWINYVLGDTELSRRVYEVGKAKLSDPETLKKKVIELLKQREQELIHLIRPT